MPSRSRRGSASGSESSGGQTPRASPRRAMGLEDIKAQLQEWSRPGDAVTYTPTSGLSALATVETLSTNIPSGDSPVTKMERSRRAGEIRAMYGKFRELLEEEERETLAQWEKEREGKMVETISEGDPPAEIEISPGPYDVPDRLRPVWLVLALLFWVSGSVIMSKSRCFWFWYWLCASAVWFGIMYVVYAKGAGSGPIQVFYKNAKEGDQVVLYDRCGHGGGATNTGNGEVIDTRPIKTIPGHPWTSGHHDHLSDFLVVGDGDSTDGRVNQAVQFAGAHYIVVENGGEPDIEGQGRERSQRVNFTVRHRDLVQGITFHLVLLGGFGTMFIWLWPWATPYFGDFNRDGHCDDVFTTPCTSLSLLSATLDWTGETIGKTVSLSVIVNASLSANPVATFTSGPGGETMRGSVAYTPDLRSVNTVQTPDANGNFLYTMSYAIAAGDSNGCMQLTSLLLPTTTRLYATSITWPGDVTGACACAAAPTLSLNDCSGNALAINSKVVALTSNGAAAAKSPCVAIQCAQCTSYATTTCAAGPTPTALHPFTNVSMP